MKLLLVGDVMLGRLVNESLRHVPPAHPWGDTLPLFLRADWRACNLECALTDHGEPWTDTPKMFHFRSDARNVEVLRAAGIDAVSLANNHVLDFGHRGLRETLRVLDKAGVAHAGAGLNWHEAAMPVVQEVHGVRIGLLSFTDNMPEWAAEPERGGILFVPVEEPDERTHDLLDLVRITRAQVDVLIVAAHWGGNWGASPPHEHVGLAHELVRAGADVIFGHSPHVCRGVEVFDGKVVLYSTGDFVDDYAVDDGERNDRSWAFELHLEDAVIHRLHLHPTVIRGCQALRAGHAEALVMKEGMRKRCAALGTEPLDEPDGLAFEIKPRVRP